MNPKMADESIVRAVKWLKAGEPIPEGYHIVSLTNHERELYSAFNRMSCHREDSSYKKPISDKQILDYVKIHGSCGLYIDDFMSMITSLDGKYLELVYDKITRENEAAKRKAQNAK